MSYSSTVTYTSVYTDSEPGKVFWGADEELSDGGSPRVIIYGYDGLPMQPVAPPSPDYVLVLEHPPSPEYVPGPEHPPSLVEDQPLPTEASPTALSPGYVADSDPGENPEEDPEEDHADYPADGGDGEDEPSDDDDDDDTDDEDEEPFEDEDDDEEEEYLAPADSPAIPIVDLVPSVGDTEAFETDETAPTPVPSPRRHTTRMSVRPQTPILLPSEAEVERLLALPIPPPSPLSPWSSPLPQIPSPPLPPPPSSLHLPPPVPISLTLSSSPLPPLPASLSVPPPVDHKEDTPKAELPPCKRLCLTTPTSRNEVRERSTAAPRPTRGHRADYGFIGTMDAEIRRQRAEEVSYGIRDVWVDPAEAVEEVAPTTLEGVNARVTELAEVQEQDTQDIYAVSEDGQDRQTQLSQRVNDYRIASQESLMATLIAQNNMPPRRTFASTARAAATTAAAAHMTAAAVEQLIEARVSAALANHETLQNSTYGHGDGSHNSDTRIRATVHTP
ncbi:hypothetical protein Tco_1450744, partial [Tanacetum coccineum]